MCNKTTYHVYDENSLVYRQEESMFYQIMETKHIARRRYDLIVAEFVDPSLLRPATLEDFDRFRIRPEGHIVPLKDSINHPCVCK
jgi:hypothetical protein